MKHINLILLVTFLFASCKSKDADDPYNPANQFNQPPLGKDTVRGVATDITFIPYWAGNTVYVTVKDDQSGALYDMQLWWHELPESGICRIDTADLIGPNAKFSLPPSQYGDDNYVLVKNPNPVNLDITMYAGRPKMTLDVKKVYVRITSETEVYYGADNKALKSQYLKPDSLGRASAEHDIELSLRNRLGSDVNHAINDFSPISPVFQRRR